MSTPSHQSVAPSVKNRTLATLAAFVFSIGTAGASTIAITEFMIDPAGTDLHHEWIELFNYGAESVDISSWTLKDNSTATFTIPVGVSIPSGGYLIVAQNGAAFTERWLNGVSDNRVISTRNPELNGTGGYIDGVFQLNNSSPGDGIYLRNAESALIWSVGFTVGTDNGVSPYRATWLTIDDFSVTNYGEPPQHGAALINRNGIDFPEVGLGYEDNNRTIDPFARTSTSTNSEGIFNEWGSPLAGGYSPVPEPTSIALLMLGSLALARRQRIR